MKLTREQLTVLNEHIAANPGQSAQDVANYFERVADLDEDTKLTIATVAMYLQQGNEVPAAYLEA